MRVILATLCLLLGFPALAHDHNRPDLDQWFMTLQSKAGGICCVMEDATGLEDVEWRSTDTDKCIKHNDNETGEFCIFAHDKWWLVPHDSVVNEPNKAGHALVWWVWYGDGTDLYKSVFIRCFMPGALT